MWLTSRISFTEKIRNIIFVAVKELKNLLNNSEYRTLKKNLIYRITKKPLLDFIILLSRFISLSPTDLLETNITCKSIDFKYKHDLIKEIKGKAVVNHDADMIHSNLLNFLSVDPVFSLEKISVLLGVSRSYLNGQHGELAKKITAKYQNQQKEQKEIRVLRIKEKILTGISELTTQGKSVTYSRVVHTVGGAGFRDPVYKQVYQEIVTNTEAYNSNRRD